MSVAGSINSQLLPTDRAKIYFERAKQLSLFSSGTSLELERLLREIYKALSYETDDIKFYLLLAKVYRANLDITSSMFCYRYILKQNSSIIAARKFLVELLAIKGKELMTLGREMKWKAKFTAARSCFDEALEYNRENNELWILKSVCHVYCEELPEAFEAICKVIKPNREVPAEVYILRAKINWGRGLTEQGNQDIRFAAALDPNHPEVLGYITRSYAKSELLYKECLYAFTKEKYKEALELVNHALHITNEDIKLFILKSRIYRMLNDLQSAYEAIMAARHIFEEKYHTNEFSMNLPPEILIQTNLILNDMAIDYASKGSYHEAILLYNKILRSEENLSNSLVAIAEHQQYMETLRQTQYPSSPPSPSKIYTNANTPSATTPNSNWRRHSGGVEKHYVNYKYYMNRGDCYRALNQLNEAILDYQAALDLEPNDWNIKTKLSLSHYIIGTNYFNQSKFYESDLELTKAISYNPRVSEYYALRGKAKYYLSDFVTSHSDYKKALELNPENTEIKLRLQQFEDPNNSSNNNNNSGSGGINRGMFSSSAPSSSLSGSLDNTLVVMVQSALKKRVSSSHAAKPLQPTKPDGNAKKSGESGGGAAKKGKGGRSRIEIDYNDDKQLKQMDKLLQQREKERQDKIDELLQQSRYKTDRKVQSIPIQDDDMIEMMLNHRQYSKLPPLKMITTELDDENHILDIVKKKKEIIYSKPALNTAIITTKEKEEILLPKILQKSDFLTAHIEKTKVIKKQQIVENEFNAKLDVDKHALWCILDTAKELAIARSHKHHALAKEKQKRRRKTTVVAPAAASAIAAAAAVPPPSHANHINDSHHKT